MKKTWVRKTLSVGILAAGALLLAPTAMAQADVDPLGLNQLSLDNLGDLGNLTGDQFALPMTVPVSVVGDALGVLGTADSFGVGDRLLESGRRGGTRQASVPVTIPVTVPGSANRAESARTIESGFLGGLVGGISQVSYGSFGTLNGNSVAMPGAIPVSACGNSLALLGAASSYGTCSSGFGGGFGYASQAVDVIEAPVQQHFVRSDNYSSCSAYVAASPCGGGGAAYGVVDSVDVVDYGYDAAQVDYGYDAVQVVEPVAIPVDACGNSLGVLGYASAYGTCGNYVDTGVVYSQSVQYVEPVPVVPVYTTPAYVLGGSDCVQICGNAGYGYAPNYGGDTRVLANGGPKVYKGNKGNKGNKRPKGDVRGDQGYGDKAPKGDVKVDDAGYDQGSARGDEAPADVVDTTDDAGYESPDQYGVKPGGRSEERFSATGFTRGFGGMGTLDLLGGLR
ncbi:chaplin family protein [Actinoplanes sp. CA-252034]|uniref:chaplin family protein n=1 Tax=Actinoplanes sp. CA-252034 TaxID=3239906 RepID=UPI003D98FDD6